MTGRKVALIRGINVGRAKRVAMADLRALVEGLGYRDVRTLLNSGNVAFTAAGKTQRETASRIEKAMAAKTGVAARVMVMTEAELAEAVDENPLLPVAHDPSRLLVAVFNEPADRARLDVLTKKDWAPDVLAVGRRVAYLWCPAGMIESPLALAVGRALGDAVTTRNWTTMTKLRALAESRQ